MVLSKIEESKVTFKNAHLEKDDEGILWIIEDLGDKGIETRNFEEVISEVFGDEPFGLTLKSKQEL